MRRPPSIDGPARAQYCKESAIIKEFPNKATIQTIERDSSEMIEGPMPQSQIIYQPLPQSQNRLIKV